jgi:hypothetical protein
MNLAGFIAANFAKEDDGASGIGVSEIETRFIPCYLCVLEIG